MIYFFKDAPDDVQILGGKGLSLVKMTKAGFVVPPGFVISASAQQRTPELDKEILRAFNKLGAERIAVRSSATMEDSRSTAWAGQLETYLNITENSLLDSVEKCWQSINSDRAKSYADQHNIKSGAVAVVVQKMVQATVSGIAFSVHPVTRSDKQVVIEAALGLCEPIVSGIVTPDMYAINKDNLEVSEKHLAAQTKKLVLMDGKNEYQEINDNTQKLSDALLKVLAQQVKKLEDYYKYPVDVEWAVENGQLYITQCRPITTL